MREEGSMSKDNFLERKKSREEQIETLRHEIEELKLIMQERKQLPSLEK